MGYKKIIAIIAIMYMVLSFNSAYAQSTIESIKKDVFVLASDSLMGRETGSEHIDKAANYIVTRFEDIGLKTTFQVINEKSKNLIKQKNIICVIEGNDSILKQEYILIGAHYDHLGFSVDEDNDTSIYNGADDNASGVAAILELAQLINRNKATIKRSVVLVAFDAEETGLNGSSYMAKNGFMYKGNKVEVSNIKLMMSLDMVGYLKKSKRLRVVGVGMLKDYWQYFSSLDLGKGYDVSFKQLDKNIIGGSDHDPFAQAGIASLYVSTGLVSPYHKPTDDAQLIDVKGIKIISNYIYGAIKNFANSEEILYSGKSSSKHKPLPINYWGMDLAFGSNQNYYTKGRMTGKTDFGLGIGLFRRHSFSNLFALKGGIKYYYLEAKRYETEVKYHTLSVPILAVFKTNTVQNTFDLSLALGGYYDYVFSSKSYSKSNYLDKHQYGIQFELEMRIMSIIFGWEARYGISNLLKNDPYGRTIQQTNLFKIGYVF